LRGLFRFLGRRLPTRAFPDAFLEEDLQAQEHRPASWIRRVGSKRRAAHYGDRVAKIAVVPEIEPVCTELQGDIF
jgi:hypothetical protein